MEQINHNFYLEKAKEIAAQSVDPSTQTGCVIKGYGVGIISTGFNHIPFAKNEWWRDRETKLKLVTHAEVAALIKCRESTVAATAYIYPWLPCGNCLSALLSAGIKSIVAPKMDKDSDRYKRWQKDFELVHEYARIAGAVLIEV